MATLEEDRSEAGDTTLKPSQRPGRTMGRPLDSQRRATVVSPTQKAGAFLVVARQYAALWAEWGTIAVRVGAMVGLILLPLVGVVVGAMTGIWAVAAYNGTSWLSAAIFLEGALLFPVPLAGAVGGLVGGLIGLAAGVGVVRVRPRAPRILLALAINTLLIVGGAVGGVALISATADLGQDGAASLAPGLLAGAVLGLVVLVLVSVASLWRSGRKPETPRSLDATVES